MVISIKVGQVNVVFFFLGKQLPFSRICIGTSQAPWGNQQSLLEFGVSALSQPRESPSRSYHHGLLALDMHFYIT